MSYVWSMPRWDLLEHELVADRYTAVDMRKRTCNEGEREVHSPDMICAIRLNHFLDRIALALICFTAIGSGDVVAQPDREINLRLYDRLEDQCRLIAVRAV